MTEGVQGLLLAAGAGRRYGGPKALVAGWLDSAVAVLLAGGCDGVTVVLGAAAEAVSVPAGTRAVVAERWAEGMGASLRTGLAAMVETDASHRARPPAAALVHLVDLPDVTEEVIARVLADPIAPETLRRAAYRGIPGHPVLIGRDHWPGVRAAAAGDRGARDYLRAHRHDLVECGDLATGTDVDRPPANPGPTGA